MKHTYDVSLYLYANATGTSTNAYATILETNVQFLEEYTVIVEETGAVNGIEYAIDVNVTGSAQWENLVTAQGVAAGAIEYTQNIVANYGNWTHCRVQVIAAVADAQGDVLVSLSGKRMH